ncbi:MAG TPA: roadblock/LC7 domain-containing protein, partial [Jiangellales bacterium]|nr:roadblock/LC7 domain-containing protein [Jiangellales bacterium]
FRVRVLGVRHVIALSSDGILVAKDNLPEAVAQKLAAAASGLVSLLRNLGDQLGAGGCSHNLTEYAGGWILTMGAGQGGALLAFADRNCDVGAVSFELTQLVNRVGDVLIPAARAAMAGPFGAVMGQYR